MVLTIQAGARALPNLAAGAGTVFALVDPRCSGASVVVALDEQTGRPVWQTTVATQMSAGVRAGPVVDGRYLWVAT